MIIIRIVLFYQTQFGSAFLLVTINKKSVIYNLNVRHKRNGKDPPAAGSHEIGIRIY